MDLTHGVRSAGDGRQQLRDAGSGEVLLSEKAFHAWIRNRPWRAVSVFAAAALVTVAAWRFDPWLLHNDALRYWTPLLDPAASPLGAFK